MKHIIEQIAAKKLVDAEASIKEELYVIAESKINEVKKMMACSEQFMKTANQKKVAMNVLEQQTDADDEKQARMNVAMNRLKKMMEEDEIEEGIVDKVKKIFKPEDKPERDMRNIEGKKSSKLKIAPKKMMEQEEAGEESSMARSELQAITKDVKTIMGKIKGNKELEAWIQSKITKSADYMNAVADYMENEKEELDEATRIKIVKARIRNGQIQRRKKISNVPGYTLRSGKMTRMTAAERRRRKLGAKRAKIKKRGKMTRILMKRKRSLQKRQRLGL